MSDAALLGDSAWLLLKTPEGERSVFVIIGSDGTLRSRIVLEAVPGARSFALDTTRQRLYLAVPAQAAVLAEELPRR